MKLDGRSRSTKMTDIVFSMCVYILVGTAGARFYCPFYLFVCLSVCLLGCLRGTATLLGCLLPRSSIYSFTHSIFGKRLPLFYYARWFDAVFGGLPNCLHDKKTDWYKNGYDIQHNTVYIAIGQCLHRNRFYMHTISCYPHAKQSTKKKRKIIQLQFSSNWF